jgi:hypothetical protein
MNRNSIETGAQLISSLMSQNKNTFQDKDFKDLVNNEALEKTRVDSNILANIIDKKEFIFISGPSGVGKSELIMHLIANFIIPEYWTFNLEGNKTVKIDLRNSSGYKDYSSQAESKLKKIIFIDTGKFNIFRLFRIIENRLMKFITLHLDKFSNIDRKILSNHTKNFINDMLKSLIVFRCKDTEQFALALSSCELYLKSIFKTNLSGHHITVPIFIDTIDDNFQTIGNSENLNIHPHNNMDRFTVVLVKRLLQTFENISLITTSNNKCDNASGKLNGIGEFITKRIELCKSNDSKINSTTEIKNYKNDFFKTKHFDGGFFKFLKINPNNCMQKVFKYEIDKFGFKIFSGQFEL